MASKSPPGGEGLLSFAKIAAMPAPLNPQSTDDHEIPPATENSHYSEIDGTGASLPNHHNLDKTPEASSIDLAVEDLGRGMQDIGLTLKNHNEGAGPLLPCHENGLLKRENSFEDDRTHLSTSSTKMTNFDSKSLASVTTFAMDEKDSVRPDDSASVQAIDEEESLAGHASGAPNSVAGSEAGSRVFREQDISTRSRDLLPVPGPLFNGSQPVNGTIPPDSAANNFIIPANPDSVQDVPGWSLEPDEKLLEAMKSPKDRVTILQLEEQIRYFIKDCTEQSLELPPSNAFGRLLAHRLADYYHLTHFVDNNVTSVRLHRTPFCRLPPPVSILHAPTPPPIAPAMKIMRRNDGGQFDGSMGGSSNHSKANSDAGDSGDGDRNGSSSGATPAKDRMALTREEREAKYLEVRERIFQDFPDSAKSEPTSGDSNQDVSRSSSTNGRKKPPKQRKPVDDSFEVRSQFNAYYPGRNRGNGALYNNPMNDSSYANQVPYLVGPGVPPPSGGHLPSGQTGAVYSGQIPVNGPPQYPVAMSPQMPSNVMWQGVNMPQQSPYPGYPAMNQPGMTNQPPSNASSPAVSTYAVPNPVPYQQTPSSAYPTNFQQPPQQRNGPPVHWPNYQQPIQPNMQANMGSYMPQNMGTNPGGYAYPQYAGQPMNPAFQNPAASHPMQSGYHPRSHFNPQTRSFVPGGVPAGRHPNRPLQTPQYGNMQPGTQPQWNGYSDAVSNRPIDPPPPMLPNRLPTGPRGNSIAKWGTPSHLPPKPPPSEVPSDFDSKNRPVPTSLPVPVYVNTDVSNGPLVVSGGVALPK